MKNYIILLAALAFIGGGCSSVNQQLSTGTTYRADMGLLINGVAYTGVASVPQAESYDIAIRSPSSMDYFNFRTCHRDITSEGLPNRTRMTYWPQWPVESVKCPALIDALNQNGKHSFGFIAFGDPEKTLEANQLKCNGVASFKLAGTSVCQAGAGLIQYIDFSVPVLFSDKGEPGCELPDVPREGSAFTFKIKPGLCVYTFLEIAKNPRSHRLYTRGYTGIILVE